MKEEEPAPISSQTLSLTQNKGSEMHRSIEDLSIEDDILAWDSERELLRAVLERAILDACGNMSSTGKKLPENLIKRQARQWLGLQPGPYWEKNKPFSFLWICQHLGICPKQIQTKILKRFFLH